MLFESMQNHGCYKIREEKKKSTLKELADRQEGRRQVQNNLLKTNKQQQKKTAQTKVLALERIYVTLTVHSLFFLPPYRSTDAASTNKKGNCHSHHTCI